ADATFTTYEERAYPAFATCRRHVHAHHGFHDRDAPGTHADGNFFHLTPSVQSARSIIYDYRRNFRLPHIVLDRPLRQEEIPARHISRLFTRHVGMRICAHLCGIAYYAIAHRRF